MKWAILNWELISHDVMGSQSIFYSGPKFSPQISVIVTLFSLFCFLFSVFCFLFSVFCSLQISVIVTLCRVLSTSTTGQVLWASGNSISSGQKTSADCSTIRKILLFSQISFQVTESDTRWRTSQWPTPTHVGRSDTQLFLAAGKSPTVNLLEISLQ